MRLGLDNLIVAEHSVVGFSQRMLLFATGHGVSGYNLPTSQTRTFRLWRRMFIPVLN